MSASTSSQFLSCAVTHISDEQTFLLQAVICEPSSSHISNCSPAHIVISHRFGNIISHYRKANISAGHDFTHLLIKCLWAVNFTQFKKQLMICSQNHICRWANISDFSDHMFVTPISQVWTNNFWSLRFRHIFWQGTIDTSTWANNFTSFGSNHMATGHGCRHQGFDQSGINRNTPQTSQTAGILAVLTDLG